MAVDTSIYGSLLRPPKSVAEYDAEYNANQANKLQNQLGQAKIDEYARGVEKQNKLAALFQGGADANALRRAGFQTEALAWEDKAANIAKDKAQTIKTGADTEKTQIETALQKASAGAQILAGVRDQATYDYARQQVAQTFGPEAASQMPAIYDPAQVEQKRQQGMSIQQQLEQVWKQKGYDLDVRKQGEVERNNAAQNKISEGQLGVSRGQLGVAQANLGLSRQRLELDKNDPKLQYDPERGVLINTRTAQVVPATTADGTALAPKPGTGNTPKISAEVQRQIGGVLSFDKDLGALEEALRDFDPRSTDQLNTTKRAKIQSLSKQAQLSAKEAAALGALSGPDMSLLEGILNDPTNMRGVISGSSGIAAQIAEARAGNQRRVQSLGQQYGPKATEGLPTNLTTPTAPAGGATKIANDAEYNALPSGAMFIGPDGKTRKKP